METVKENKMGVMPPLRLMLNMSLPMMASMLVQAMYNIVDSVNVSRICEDALTALSLSFPMQMLMMAFALGTSVGLNSLAARRLGAQRVDDANTAAGNGLVLGFLTSLIFVVIGLFFTGAYFDLLTTADTDPMVAVYGKQYLSIVLGFCPAVSIAVGLERILQATGHTTLSMVSQIAGALTNIILDPIMIFGKFGCPAMGVTGAAVATVIGQCVSLVVGVVSVMFAQKIITLKPRHFALKGETVKEIYRVGIPTIIMQACSSLTNFFFNKILIIFSSTAVAVLGAYFKLNSFVFMPVFGLNSGCIPIIGYNYGAKKKKRITDTVKYGLIVGVAIMAVGTALFEFYPSGLLSLFEAGENMMEIGSLALRVIALSFLPAAVSIMLCGAFQGIGIGYMSMINSLIRNVVVLLPAGYILAAAGGLNAVWWAFPISEFIAVAAAVLMYRKAYREYIAPLGKTDGQLPDGTETAAVSD